MISLHGSWAHPACNELLDEAGVRHFLLALLNLAAFQLFILIQRTSVKFEMGRPNCYFSAELMKIYTFDVAKNNRIPFSFLKKDRSEKDSIIIFSF